MIKVIYFSICFYSMFLHTGIVRAQSKSSPSAQTYNVPETIYVAVDKTTSIIFHHPIVHTDLGSNTVIAQRLKNADSILLLKAAKEEMKETNVSVLTEDGAYFSFLIKYDKTLPKFIYRIGNDLKDSVIGKLATPEQSLNNYGLKLVSDKLIGYSKWLHGVKNSKGQMHAALDGIYVLQNALFFQLDIKNRSPIDFDIDFIRFYFHDKKKAKRTAIQEQEIIPLLKGRGYHIVKADDKIRMIIPIEKFTLPDDKYFLIEINEKNGGRHLHLKVKNEHILQAKMINGLND